MLNRRQFLKLSMAVGTVAVVDLGLDKLSHAEEPKEFTPLHARTQELEARVDPQSGEVKVNSNIVMRNSACLGCYSSCGNRVKIDTRTGQMLRVYGNPYNPNNAQPTLDFEAPLLDAYRAFSSYQDYGYRYRATLCQRGNATLEAHYDPNRILVPLKRAGKRGEGKWVPITWEEAVKETVEGGKLFADLGEGQTIEGFRQVHDVKTPLDPAQPELGPKSNQLSFIGGRGDGRTVIANKFAGFFGTKNFHSHGFS
ncbi:hypothetical protein [Rubeoparvulum massiliense]|uniref:hypothetical protein n=1 Tax=Rubeoparvulum massiliense TaxID=1631346 RepID=UPI000ADE84B5|nr:hypothetical protein [Rubeoparvulum massiliense]